MTTAVTKIESLTPEPSAVLAVIARAAADPAVDVDKMDRLLQMQERVLARQAEVEFNAAMADAQSEMGRISADATNPQTRSKYATYAKLDAALRPIYTRRGFALSFGTGDAAHEGYVRVQAHVSHLSGFTRTYHVDMPADGKGAKGNDVMTKTHAVGAAMSYGMRYLLKMIFNVAVGDDDRDGNEPKPTGPKIADAELDELIELAGKAGTTVQDLCAVCRVEWLEDLPASQFVATKKLLMDRIKVRSARAGSDPNAQFDRMERGQ